MVIFDIGAVIPVGPVTTGDTWDIAPFPDFVVVGVVPRETFHPPLEVPAS